MFRAVAEPRFLEDLVVPRDVMTIVDKLDIPAGHDQAVYRFILAASVFNGGLVGETYASLDAANNLKMWRENTIYMSDHKKEWFL